MTPTASRFLARQQASAFTALLAMALPIGAVRTQIGLVDKTTSILVPPLPASYYPGAAWGDVDGDGWCDLYVTNYYGPNHLFSEPPGRVHPYHESLAAARRQHTCRAHGCDGTR
jgi:hypothetical protein